MKEEIKNELLQRSLKYLDKVEAFVGDEVPAFVKELMEFKFVEHLTTGVLDTFLWCSTMGVLMSLLVTAVVCCTQDEIRDMEVTPLKNGLIVTVILLPVMFIIGLAGNNEDFVKAYKAKTAPRVYLMDYVRNK